MALAAHMTAHALHLFDNLPQFSRIGRVGTRVLQSVLVWGAKLATSGGYAPVRMVIIHRCLVGANNLSGVALFLALTPELICPDLNLLPRHATLAKHLLLRNICIY